MNAIGNNSVATAGGLLSANLVPSLMPFPTPAFVQGLAAKALGLDGIFDIYDALRGSATAPIYERVLDHLDIRQTVSTADLANVPRTGPVVVTANHPFGILDGALLATLLRRIRPDVRFLANALLASIPELADLLIPVEITGKDRTAGRNSRGLRQALDFLTAGGMLVVFPAGQVSHFRWRQREVADPEWNPQVARLISAAVTRAPGLKIVPMHIGGANSRLFQLSAAPLRTALLARELLNKRNARVPVRIGKPIDAAALAEVPGDAGQIDYLRWRTYLLGTATGFKPDTRRRAPWLRRTTPVPEPIAEPSSRDAMAAEVASLSPHQRLDSSAALEVYVASASQIPSVLHEIGRLREIAFRDAGEGTGRSVDIDRFDQHYLHLFVWNAAKAEVAGAYRIACTDQVCERHGIDGLYTATLFRFGPDFLDALGPALELGRSFIRLEYQKGFGPLLLLWKGIGKFVARHPRYKVLFGPVTISGEYTKLSKELMVSFLKRHARLESLTRLVRARNVPALDDTPVRCRDIDQLSGIVSELEPRRWGVPVLLRQYLRMGGKLLGFNLDPEFSNAIDGLILVDLTRTERKLLDRYLGAAEAQQFLDFQERTTWNSANR